MNIELKFAVNEQVSYGPIIGRVVAIFKYKDEPMQYQVEYIDSTGALNTIWKYDYELTSILH